MELIVYFLIAYGISNIMVFSSIFEGWRLFWKRHNPSVLGELFSCMICLPFWVGIFLSFTIFSISDFYLYITENIFKYFFDGCLTSGGVWLIHTLQEKWEK